MKSLQLTSGDLLADRRADYAEMLLAAGAAAAAADLMRDALALVPAWAAGWFRLGEMREAFDVAGAVDAWRETLRLDPTDRFGASLKLGLHGAAHAIDTPPSAFVETLFDQYADDFDSALVERLGYRAPVLIAEALAKVGATSFAHVVDLGCGTGLMGERLRTSASFLEGYDLSAGMLRKAQAKGVYDRLERLDLQLWHPDGAHADLIVAADVFNYVGALDKIFANAFATLRPGGLFAFSVESLDAGADFTLRESRRYAHSCPYVVRELEKVGFRVLSIDRAEIRIDAGIPVVGTIVASCKDSPIGLYEPDAHDPRDMAVCEGSGAHFRGG